MKKMGKKSEERGDSADDITAELPVIPQEQINLMTEFADELFSFLFENGMMHDPTEATVVASAFCVEQYERGWRYRRVGREL